MAERIHTRLHLNIARIGHNNRAHLEHILYVSFYIKQNIHLMLDPNGSHNEETWSKHFEEAIKFLLK